MPLGLRFLMWLISWVDLVVAIVSILTFNFYCPSWDMDFRCWLVEREMKHYNERVKNEQREDSDEEGKRSSVDSAGNAESQ